VELAKIEDRIDRTASGAIAVSDELGGIRFTNMMEVMEFAKMLAISKEAVPQHLRGEPGICLAVCIQALEWRFSPFAVANKSYVVNGRLAWESQLVHAVIEQRAPLVGRIRHSYEGEGDERRCIVSGRARGEKEDLIYTSPPIGKITPKNSPLWKTKPDLQLYYNASRDWCRVYFPDVLLGVFSEDELRDSEGDMPRDVTPKPDVGTRLKGGNKGRGFSQAHVEKQIEHKPGETIPDAKPTPEPVPVETPADVKAAVAGEAESPEPDMEKVRATAREWAEYFDAQRAAVKAASADDLDGIVASIKASIKRGHDAKELDDEEAATLTGEFNAAALEQKRAAERKGKK